MSALAADQLDAVGHGPPLLRYVVRTQYADPHDGKGVVSLTGRLFKAEKVGFAVPHGNNHLESINRILLQLNEKGQYLETYERCLAQKDSQR